MLVDDMSMLLLHSKKLEDLRLHFSPRMRRECESSLSFHSMFGRCAKAGYLLNLKHFALHNFFGNMDGMDLIFNPETCKSVTFLDTFGGPGSSPSNVYIDESWREIPMHMRTDFRSTRTNEYAMRHADLISKATGMERMYFISDKVSKAEGAVASPITPSGDTPPADHEMLQTGREYLYALTRFHGQTLKHLLLRDQWALTPDEVAELVRYCPNLEQLGLALNFNNHRTMRLLLPFLPKLKVFRILHNEWLSSNTYTLTHEERVEKMSADLWKCGAHQLQWMGIADTVYKVGRNYQAVKDDGTTEWKREVTVVPREEVQHIEIFFLDVLDIDAEPIAPFSP